MQTTEEHGGDGAYQIAAAARAEASAAKTHIDIHERQCAERYAGILTQITEIKSMINRGIYMLLAGMAGLIVAMLKGALHF